MAAKAKKSSKTIEAVKAFDADLKCKDFQFETGKAYTHDGALNICESGFHSIEGHPFEAWSYYPPSINGRLTRYAVVTAGGEILHHSDDSKICSASLRIDVELSLPEFIQRGVAYILSKADCAKEANTGYQSVATNTGYQSAATNTGDQSAATNTGYWSAATNTGYRSAATNTGYQSAATNTGDQSAATNTGDQSAAEVSGKHSIAHADGRESKARASKGSAFTLVERDTDGRILSVFAAIAGRDGIEPDQWYALKNGKPVKA